MNQPKTGVNEQWAQVVLTEVSKKELKEFFTNLPERITQQRKKDKREYLENIIVLLKNKKKLKQMIEEAYDKNSDRKRIMKKFKI